MSKQNEIERSYKCTRL